MYAVGKLSSYISQGVYTVSAPFHPFGGAVDIIVVQQEDGSFKSSPWYVRFGKFQGVLKTREKIVNICVNGVEAGFHMYLDHKGEAYFLKDSCSDEGGHFLVSPPSSGDETDEKMRKARFKKSQSYKYDAESADSIISLDNGSTKIIARTNSKRSRLLGLMFGRKSMKENELGGSVEGANSVERAKIAADLLETKWSTNLQGGYFRGDNCVEQTDSGVTNDDTRVVSSYNEVSDDNFKTTVVRRELLEEVEIHNPSIVNDRHNTVEDPNSCTSTDESRKEFVDSEDGSLDGGCKRDVARQVHFEEIMTHTSSSGTRAEVLEVYTLEAGDFGGTSKVNSAQESLCNGFTFGAQSPGSDEGGAAPEEKDQGESEVGYFSHEETMKSMSATQDTVNLPLGGSKSLQRYAEIGFETDEHICEETLTKAADKGSFEDSSLFEGSDAHSPSTVAFDMIRDGCSSSVLLNSTFSESEVIYQDKVSRTEGFGFDGNQHQRCEEASSPSNCHIPVPDTISFGPNSDRNQEFKCNESEATIEKPSFSNRPSRCQLDSRDSEDKQFLFSDMESFSVKEIKHEVPIDNGVVETEEHESDTDHEECFESVTEVSASQTTPLAIPRSYPRLQETQSFDGLLGANLTKSLPILRTQIHDLERSILHHPLSCSLEQRIEDYDQDTPKVDISSSSKLGTGFKRNNGHDGCVSETADTAVGSESSSADEVRLSRAAVDPSLCKHLLFEGMGADAASGVFDFEKENKFEPQGMIAVDREVKNLNGDPSTAIVPSGGSWRIWPFSQKKSKTLSTIPSAPKLRTQESVKAVPMRSNSMMGDDDIKRAKFGKKQVRSLTPTSEQITSLNLKEGRNVITFNFSTAMLGQQQVDARIYLWKWNTRIVISDVDGTITKSDVLGQFMPLVGKDWSQTGVAHLFSAIKENGYQFIFLSARSISQAYLTRQFLFNLKQDGKALPDGPVVISPDGLFPSLYREVIRRAPHEFKISCLEDIKALFPPECNPFYAGFGNRDTDEFSYLRVGVPKGKIFIINPKGEVAVSRRVDTKSYTSLHALVNGMFPSMSTSEQEDFNSWNYWKLPLPDVDV